MAPLTGDPKSYPTTDFADGMTGHCLCRSITVTIKDKNLFTSPRSLLCHCANCRAASGSSVSANIALDASQVTIEEAGLAKGASVADDESVAKGEGKGRLRVFADTETQSGTPMMRSFCDRCGTPIKSETSNSPGKVILKLGIFPRMPAPAMEVFASHRQDWETGYEGAQAFKTGGGSEKMDD